MTFKFTQLLFLANRDIVYSTDFGNGLHPLYAQLWSHLESRAQPIIQKAPHQAVLT